MTTRLDVGLKVGTQLPEPGRFWVRYAPRHWPGPERPWTDLARARLGEAPRGEAPGELPALEAGPLDDLLYLPPVAPALAAARDALARSRLADGTPVLVQLLPGEPSPAPVAPAAVTVVDLLPALLARDLDALARLPAGVAAVWPLVPGLTDDPDLWREGCGLLAAAGPRTVQALAPALGPAERRRLAALGGEGAFDALFHREPPAERDFARVAARCGLAPFLARPLPRPPVLRIENRRVAGALALAGELALRLGRAAEGEACYRAARWVDRTHYDLAALAREGNLGVLGWLEGMAREVVAEHAATGASRRVADLLAEYVEEEGGLIA